VLIPDAKPPIFPASPPWLDAPHSFRQGLPGGFFMQGAPRIPGPWPASRPKLERCLILLAILTAMVTAFVRSRRRPEETDR
jgi:hypothetical protein